MAVRKMDYVQPVDPTPADKVKGPPCRWPMPGERLELYPAEPQVLFYLTHYVGDRTRPHLGEVCWCHKMDEPCNSRLVGWILAWERTGGLSLCNVTLNAYKYCPDLQNKDVDLRTKKLVLQRIGRRPNGKVFAKVEERDVPVDRYPPVPFTQRDQLMRVWFKATDPQEVVNQTAQLLDELGSRDPYFPSTKG